MARRVSSGKPFRIRVTRSVSPWGMVPSMRSVPERRALNKLRASADKAVMPGFLSLLMLAGAIGNAHPSQLVGRYDGGQMEVAAGLELSADGRFRYGLSYGALDEEASGTWHADGAQVVLDSDPVKAPHFTLLSQTKADDHALHVLLQVPGGMDPQYFRAALQLADGTVIGGQLSEEGLSLPLEAGQQPSRLQIILPLFEIASDPVTVDVAKGLRFGFRFEPNDLGHAEFKSARLTVDKGQLILARHGLELHFRRLAGNAR